MYSNKDLIERGYFIAEIDGLLCANLVSFLDQIATAFEFPDYYGGSINALWDCIGDLSWLKENNYALIIRNSNNFLKNENEKTRDEIKDLLLKITEDWKNVPNYKGEDEFRQKSDFKVIYD